MAGNQDVFPDLGHLMQVAGAARGYSDSLALNLAGAFGDDLKRKADIPKNMPFSIPATGWQGNGVPGYPYRCDIDLDGVSGVDRAGVTVAPAGLQMARECGLCPINESLDGAVRLYAEKIPEGEIPAEIWIEKGAV